MALLWEPLKQPPKEVINHQKKKRLCTVFIKRNSQLIQSCLCQVRGVGRDSLSPGVSNSQMNWVLFLEEIPQCRVSFLWLVTSRGGVLSTMQFIDKYWSCSSSTLDPALQQSNFICSAHLGMGVGVLPQALSCLASSQGELCGSLDLAVGGSEGLPGLGSSCSECICYKPHEWGR